MFLPNPNAADAMRDTTEFAIVIQSLHSKPSASKDYSNVHPLRPDGLRQPTTTQQHRGVAQ